MYTAAMNATRRNHVASPRIPKLHPPMSSQQSSGSPSRTALNTIPTKPKTASLKIQSHLTLSSFVSVRDNPSRPPYSYPELIKMSISKAPTGRLTLAQIYKWISETYPFYKPSGISWKNSIRSNLSVNKAFVREERPEGDHGIGSYWSIQHGMECRIRKFKARSKGNRSSLTSTGPLRINPQSPIPDMPSDNTPTSTDSFVREERVDSGSTYPSIPTSSPTAIIRSLSRIDRYFPPTRANSPYRPRRTSSSRTWTQKRTFASVHQAKKVRFSLPSDAHRPNINRGRAEEEIARLRWSSSECHATPGSGRTSSSPSHPDTRVWIANVEPSYASCKPAAINLA